MGPRRRRPMLDLSQRERNHQAMNTRKTILTTAAVLAVVGTLGYAGASVAHRAYGGFGGGGLGMMRVLGGEQLLREIDADRDDKLTQAEIDRFVAGRLERFDADKNGRLSVEEFTALWADLTRPITVRAFQFLDPDGDGAVTKGELDDRFSRLVSRFDRNGDGVLSMEDRRRGGHDGGRGEGRGERNPRDGG